MAEPDTEAVRARVAVGALFVANGALFANVVPRYPDLKADLDLSNAAFGSAVAAYGAGALAAGLLAGVVVARWGSGRVAPVSTVAIGANLVLLGVAPSLLTLAAVLFVAGAMDSVADVAGNVHGLRVERRYGRSILNSLHGLWSVGAVVGGLMGAGAAGLAIPLVWHLSIAAAVFVGLALAASRFVLPGHDDTDRTTTTGSRAAAGRARVAGAVVALGVIAACAQVMEDATATWGAVYLRGDLGAAAAVGGLGFVALQGMQTLGRLLADRVVTRYGDRAVARVGAALAGCAMTAALVWPAAVTTVLAFGVVGLGIGTLIPAALRTADTLPRLPSGAGVSLVGTLPRMALLGSPLLVGVTADAYGLRVALAVIPLAALLVLCLASALPRAAALR